MGAFVHGEPSVEIRIRGLRSVFYHNLDCPSGLDITR